MSGVPRSPVLLFDGECPTCTQLAEELLVAAGDRLAIASLRETAVQDELDRLGVARTWEPMLLTGPAGRRRRHTGTAMAIRLLPLVGLRAGIMAARRARRLRSEERRPAGHESCHDCRAEAAAWRAAPDLRAAVERTRRTPESHVLGAAEPQDVWREDDTDSVMVVYALDSDEAMHEKLLVFRVVGSDSIDAHVVGVQATPTGWRITRPRLAKEEAAT